MEVSHSGQLHTLGKREPQGFAGSIPVTSAKVLSLKIYQLKINWSIVPDRWRLELPICIHQIVLHRQQLKSHSVF